MGFIAKLWRPGIIFVLITGAFFLLRFALQPVYSAFNPQGAAENCCIVLDAGHGGVDGGAVAADGTVESQLNLQIVHRLHGLLLFLGRDTCLTRAGEGDLSSPDAATIREKKVSDLKNRVAYINEMTPSLVISIHQNFLGGHPEVRGAQVFYHPLAPSEQVAASIQQVLNCTVNTSSKNAKPIDPGIYLMKHINCPAVLVECGFLSSSADTASLRSSEHQKLLSTVIAAGVLQYQSKEGAT